MVDVVTQPLIAEKNAIRVDPYAQPSSASLANPNGPLPPSVARSAGLSARTPSAANNPDVDGDGQLSPEEVGHLQQAAASGQDQEAFDLLNALKLPLGIAAGAAGLYAAGAGAVIGGNKLLDAYMQSKGMMMFGDQARSPNGAKMPVPVPDPEAQKSLTGHNGQKLLPAPQGKITDTTGTRFNQPGSQSPRLLPDSNKKDREVDAAYAQRDAADTTAMGKAELEKSLAQAKSMRLGGALRNAAKAMRH